MNIEEQDLQEPNPHNIELPAELAEGEYANLVMILHSNAEFVLDFIRMMPGLPQPRVKSRVILTPEHAKRLVAALNDNIRQYEETYGAIQMPQDTSKTPIHFSGQMGEA
ncbi:DUF3467 domain-containing protein [Eisenibacter elegans]|jgi:hypothetical protein|uniref:DUF3467 domain-containing protein n=1 Tax=Eisenibacter elegans TaxID=997 RepID=UPI00040E0F64|nr:DUF3467 domain-containing protein [Eisenibacter elegans]